MSRFHLVLLLALLSVGSARPAPAAESAESLLRKASAVLAQLEGEIKVPGLKEPVEVLRDRWGIPHIYAKNAEDLFFAQGFVTAQDRLFQIDQWRRVAVGETAEVVGRQGLEADRFARLLMYRGELDREWTSYSPDAHAITASFTRGINAYIDHIGDRLPVEFQILAVKPKKWQAEDCLGRMAGIIMTRNFHNEIVRAELVAAVGVEKARRIAPTDPPRAYAPAPSLDLAGIDRSILAGYNEVIKTPAFKLGGDEALSEEQVVGILGIDVGDAPAVAQHLDRLLQAKNLDLPLQLGQDGFRLLAKGLRRFRRAGPQRPSESEQDQ